jgi:hypothetical protein
VQTWNALPLLAALVVAASCGGKATTGSALDGGASANDSMSSSLSTSQLHANYFYCVVEPEIIMGGLTHKPCGDDGSHECHSSDRVPEMALSPLPMPVTCSGSGTAAVPTNPSQFASGTAAAMNLRSVSFEMSVPYTSAPLFVFATGTSPGHPQVFSADDTAVVDILRTWATTE